MKDLKTLGDKVKLERVLLSLSQAKLADAMAIDTTLLSKIENGHIQPTQQQLQAIIDALRLDDTRALELWLLSGRSHESITARRVTDEVLSNLERSKKMSVKPKESEQPVLNLSIDRSRIQTVYSDIAVVVSNENGMVLQFGQILPAQNSADVVASVGVSFDHARKIASAINEELQKNER